MKQTIRMNEAELNRLISESVMRVLNEAENEETDEGYFGQMFKRGVQKGAENVKNAATSAMNKGKEVAGNIKQGYNNMQANRADYNQQQGVIKQNQKNQKALTKVSSQLNNIKQYVANNIDPTIASAINNALDRAIKTCGQNGMANTYSSQNISGAQNAQQDIMNRGMFNR